MTGELDLAEQIGELWRLHIEASERAAHMQGELTRITERLTEIAGGIRQAHERLDAVERKMRPPSGAFSIASDDAPTAKRRALKKREEDERK